MYGAQTEFGKLKRVLMHRPGSELDWVTDKTFGAYNFRRPVDKAKFQSEYDTLTESISEAGADVVLLTDVLTDDDEALAYIARRPNMCYTRDLAVVMDKGVVLMSMGIKGRKGDTWVIGRAMQKLGVPILGAIEPPGFLEGGGVQFMDERTAIVSLCERATEVGVKQFCDLVLGTCVDRVVMVMVPDGQIHIDGSLMFIDRQLAIGHLASLDLHPTVVFERGKSPRYTFFSAFAEENQVELIETSLEERRAMAINFVCTAPLQAVGWSWSARARCGRAWASASAFRFSGRPRFGDPISSSLVRLWTTCPSQRCPTWARGRSSPSTSRPTSITLRRVIHRRMGAPAPGVFPAWARR